MVWLHTPGKLLFFSNEFQINVRIMHISYVREGKNDSEKMKIKNSNNILTLWRKKEQIMSYDGQKTSIQETLFI